MHLPQLDSLERFLDVSFNQKGLLGLALVHSSYLHENPGTFSESNERLEFLGDAVLGMVVAEELFARNPHWPEGRLTQARAALVQGESLAGIARGLYLGRYLYMGKGEEAGGGRERPTNLAGAFEALVGALFLDQGYGSAQQFVLRVLAQELSRVGSTSAVKNPKSTLQEAVQAKGLPTPTYRIVHVSGQDHARQFTVEVTVDGKVVGRGVGSRKSQAEQEAAAESLRAMGE